MMMMSQPISSSTRYCLLLQQLLCLLPLSFVLVSSSTSNEYNEQLQQQIPFEHFEQRHQQQYANKIDDVSSSSSSSSSTTNSNIESFNRMLEVGDFDRFNELFRNANIALPDTDFNENNLEMSLTNLRCYDVVIGDIQTSWTLYNSSINAGFAETIGFDVNIDPFTLNCAADYSFKYTLLFIPITGSGSLAVQAGNSAAKLRIDLNSVSGFQTDFPMNVNVANCDPALNIAEITFNGEGIVDDVLNIAENAISNIVEDRAKEAICTKLNDLGPGVFMNFLNKTKSRIDVWMTPIPDDVANPLYIEQYNFTKPSHLHLLNFMQNSSSLFLGDNNDSTTTTTNGTSAVGNLLITGMKQADSFLGGSMDDPDGPTANKTDLAINVLLRNSKLLNENRIFELKFNNDTDNNAISDIFDGTSFDPILYDREGSLTHTKIEITSFRAIGLDTITKISPFQPIGKYTITNEIQWSSLKFEMDLTLTIQPSTAEDSMITDPDPSAEIIENVTISIDFTNVNVNASIFLAIDAKKLDSLQLGSLLYPKNVLPCILETLHDVQVSGLLASVDDMSQPTITGFVTKGIDRVIQSVTEAALAAFEPTIKKAMPYIFQGPVRNIMKKEFLNNFLMNNTEFNNKCPRNQHSVTKNMPPYIDFRDMLLNATDSKKLGGSGNEMYGTFVSRIFNSVRTMMTASDDDDSTNSTTTGQPKINDMLLRPFTKRQSGTEGTFLIEKELFSFGGNQSTSSSRRNRLLSLTDMLSSSSFLETNFKLALSKIRLNNLDTVTDPLILLQPTKNANTLRHELNIGMTGRPLNVTILLSTSLFGNDNAIDIGFSVDTLRAVLEVAAMIQTAPFMSFPLGSTLTLDCWLAAMKAAEMGSDGQAVESKNGAHGISIPTFDVTMSSFTIGSNCVSCESAGTSLLPELISILEVTNATRILGSRLPSLLESVVTSNTVQTFIDRRINDAPMFCPSNPAYQDGSDRPDYGSINFPTLDGESIDTLLYTGALIGEVGFVVFAESQRQLKVDPMDPLSTQDTFVAPDGIRLIDWTNISSSTGLGPLVDELFNQIRNKLGENVTEGGGLGELFDMGGLFGNWLSDGSVDLNLDVGIQQEDFSLMMKSVRIFGLDNLNFDKIMEPIGAQTLSFVAQFDSIKVEIDIEAGSSISPPQKITMDFTIKNLNVDLAIFAAFDLDKIGNLQLGSLLDTGTIFQCILSTAFQFDIPMLNVTLGSFTKPKFKGYLNETGAALSSVTETIYSKYKTQIVESIPAIFAGVFKDSVTNMVSSFSNDSRCYNHTDVSEESSTIDFRDLFLAEADSVLLGGSGSSPYGNLARNAYKLLKEKWLVTDETTGLSAINRKLIAKITEARSGVAGDLLFNGDIFNQNREVRAGGLDALIQLRAYDGYIRNLDTLGAPLAILEPINGEPSILNNTATIGIGQPLTLGMSFSVGLSDKDTNIMNDVEISFAMDQLQLLATTLLKLSEKTFFGFPIKDIGNLQCWLATFPAPQLDKHGFRVANSETSLRLTEFEGSVDIVMLNVSCNECSGPEMVKATELLSSESNADAVTALANTAFDFAKKMIEGEFLSVAIDRALNDAPKQCPHNAQYVENYVKPLYTAYEVTSQESSVSFIVGVLILCISLIFAVLAICLATKMIVRRRHQKWLEKLSREQVLLVYRQQREKQEKESEINVSTTSMFKSSSIPMWIRWFMPIVILGNIGFFLSGHFSLGASVTIIASLGGETLRSDNFFQFSMAKSTIEIWNSGGQALALMIFAASFAWPYSKSFITLGLWFAPTNYISVSTRGSILLWLDALAKWSIVDIFVLVVTIICFRVSIKSPDVVYLPEGFYQLDLLVIPKWGLYANMIAQLICQISSHYIIHYHRRLVDDALNRHLQVQQTGLESMDSDDDEDSSCAEQARIIAGRRTEISSAADKLCQHAFRRAHRGESDKLVARRAAGPLLVFLSVLLSILVILGCALPTFTVRILGIIGVMVESGQEFKAADNSYSVFTMIQTLFDQAKLTGDARGYVGLTSLSILVVLSVLVVPIVQAVTLLVQWFVPLNQIQRHRLSIANEILQAWQYAEVYLLAILVASWQLGPISEFMINPFCKSLGGFFGQLVYYGILKEEDAQCLKTDISIDPNFYLLFVSALVLVVLNTFVMNAVAHYFHDIESAKTFDANRKAYDLEDLGTWEENDDRNEDTRSNILPIEVRYTDRFRWLLHREDAMLSYITRPDDAAPSGTAIFDLSPPSSVAYQPNRVSQFLDEDDAESDLVTLPFESEIIVDTSNDRSLLTDDDNQFNTLPAGTNTAYDFADINDAQFDNILDELSVGESGIFTTDSFDATTKDVRTRDID